MRVRSLTCEEGFSTDVPGCVRTLAGAGPGAVVEVVDFLAYRVRVALRELGVEAGSVVSCRDRADRGVVIELAGGHSVVVLWAHAHRVRVEQCAPAVQSSGRASASASSSQRVSAGWSRA